MDIRDAAHEFAYNKPGTRRSHTSSQSAGLECLMAFYENDEHSADGEMCVQTTPIDFFYNWSTNHLVNWLAGLQVQNGAIFCQLVHILHADAINMAKVRSQPQTTESVTDSRHKAENWNPTTR
jgi:hypothetical protein